MNKTTFHISSSGNEIGSAIIMVLILSSLILTQTLFIARSVHLYRESVYESYMESKLRYAAISGLAFIPDNLADIPVIEGSIPSKSDLYLNFGNSLKLDGFDDIDIGLLSHSDIIYSIAIYNRFRCIVYQPYHISFPDTNDLNFFIKSK